MASWGERLTRISAEIMDVKLVVVVVEGTSIADGVAPVSVSRWRRFKKRLQRMIRGQRGGSRGDGGARGDRGGERSRAFLRSGPGGVDTADESGEREGGCERM